MKREELDVCTLNGEGIETWMVDCEGTEIWTTDSNGNKYYYKSQADKVMDDYESKIKNLEKANAELIKRVQDLEDENNKLEDENKHLDDMVDAYQKSEALDIEKLDKKDERIKELEEQCTKYQAELMNNDPALNYAPPTTEEKEK